MPVRGGVLDSAAHLLAMDQGIPVTVVLPIEVKNVRGWIFPWSQELYQLLHKASLLQIDHPDRSILPFLVCRRMQFVTGRMAKELGFFGVETRVQPISPTTDPVALEEVRVELGYFDLIPTLDANEALVSRVAALQSDAHKRAARWRLWAPILEPYFKVLREEHLDGRREVMWSLYDKVRESPHWQEGWPSPRPEPEFEDESFEDLFDEKPDDEEL
jgi:hypothetical protein